MKSTIRLQKKYPVIAAVREVEDLNMALKSAAQVIFLMGGSLSDVKAVTQTVQCLKKQIFLHVELIKGLGRDKEAIEFISSEIRPEGVVATKPYLAKIATKFENLSTVLQIFMIDSQAFQSSLKTIASVAPDAVEIMPGLIPRVIAQVKSHFDLPLITAGLIKQSHEVDAMIAAGCLGVIVSEQSLWAYIPQ